MTAEQFRLETQRGITQILNNFMDANQIPAAYMEDAINKYLVGLKDQVMQEFIMAASQPTIQEQSEKEEKGGSE